MFAKRLIAFVAAVMLGLGFTPEPAQVQAAERAQIELLAEYYAQYYSVPLDLVRRVINRESTFNPRARNGPYYGLMQIHPQTARTMGYTGPAAGLLDAETNLIYAVKYLRGAWLLANGSHDRAVQLYSRGYYYQARDAGMLEVTGLRPGPASPPTPTPPQFAPAVVAAAAAPAEPVQAVAAVAPVQAVAAIAPLGFLPPARPIGLHIVDDEPESPALTAIATASTSPSAPQPPARPARATEAPGTTLAPASADTEEPRMAFAASPTQDLRPSVDLVKGTFDLLDSLAIAQR